MLIPESPCNCLGDWNLSASSHLVLAGLLGAMALVVIKGIGSEKDVVVG